jgi:hypothetical protein
MRAFLMSIVALLAITFIAASTLWMVPMSSTDVYQSRGSVRL